MFGVATRDARDVDPLVQRLLTRIDFVEYDRLVSLDSRVLSLEQHGGNNLTVMKRKIDALENALSRIVQARRLEAEHAEQQSDGSASVLADLAAPGHAQASAAPGSLPPPVPAQQAQAITADLAEGAPVWEGDPPNAQWAESGLQADRRRDTYRFPQLHVV